MDSVFKKAKSRELQEWVEAKIKEVLPEEIEIFSRLKGNVESDIEYALANLGLAVVVSPYLPQNYMNYATCVRTEGVIAFSVIENVMNNSLKIGDVEVHADNIQGAIIKHLYDKEFENASILFEPLEDASPETEPIVVLIQKLKTEITI